MNPFHALPSYFFEIRFDVVPSTPLFQVVAQLVETLGYKL
jgi:hypothetical protein